MEIMIMENQSISQLYSELSLNPDLPTLAERCKLLTEILLDCTSLPQTQPVSRCLGAYLEEMKAGLTESMRDFQVVEIEDEAEQPRQKEWLLEDTETKCDYCRALNHILLVSHFDRDMLPHLTGLLHDITHSMAADVVAPQSAKTVIHIIS
ncbi:TPA: hypothetical protein ONC27_000685 [Enterobacter asburiae]|uniref:hypothetical protein n=2 Tax=Enterobacter TaxID=547 RepID=UPI001865A990|nr:hypothetical protein [Enterobacter asburiae]EGQ5321057.1 hypothetical protein [Enterobacter asburiae]BDS24823.1 hypothetical protein KAM576c_14420 [Enterobacter asburiae]HCR1889082.1 hypothetical protein [Enterobacter asburiae]HCR1893938.1 hypothetical protein [Enterobacter asburiae]HED1912415.1 hypothetical protein [Enterobacter asburiae]